MEAVPSSATRLLLFVFVLLLIPLATHATPVHYCDKNANYVVKVKGVGIAPNPVVRGKPAKFSISATAGDAITGGQLVIDVSFFGAHIHQEAHELCSKTSCPIPTGDFVLSHEQSLPSFTPPGTYTLKMKMLGEDGAELSCVTFDFKIKLRSPVADS